MTDSQAEPGVGSASDASARTRFPNREAAAIRTREAIVGAAARLFRDLGYDRTTMRAIATAAGVSVESVNLAGPKRALLAAAFSVTFAGDEGDHSLTEREALVRILSMPDLHDALTAYVELITESIARSAGIWAAVRSAATSDPEVAAMFDDMLVRRRADIGQGAIWLLSRGVIPPTAVEDATATLSLVVAHETYEHLVGQFDWSMERYRAWVQTAIQQLIIAPHAR